MTVSGLLNRPVIPTPMTGRFLFMPRCPTIIPIFQKYNKSADFSNYKLDKAVFPWYTNCVQVPVYNEIGAGH